MNYILQDINKKYIAEIKSEDSKSLVMGYEMNVIFSFKRRMYDIK